MDAAARRACNASNAAGELLCRATTVNGVPLIAHNLGDADGDFLQVVVDSLKSRFQGVVVSDKGKTFNTDLIHTIETGYLLDLADCMVTGAIARTESRGAHSRTDFTERDDENWMKHTLAYADDGEIRLDYSEVTMTKYEPQVRTY